jgi:hypothetical protein
MIQRAWAWLRRKAEREGSTTAQVEELLQQSEDKLHEAEMEAQEAEELTSSLREMRVQNGFRERMVLKIQGGLR